MVEYVEKWDRVIRLEVVPGRPRRCVVAVERGRPFSRLEYDLLRSIMVTNIRKLGEVVVRVTPEAIEVA